MARIITKELALKIVDKLKAKAITSRNKAHDEYAFEYKGLLIAVLSIRRCSEKDKGHDYIPKDIYLSSGQAKRLAQCPLKFEEYIEILIEKGVVPKEPESKS
jgi:hypothetical protein